MANAGGAGANQYFTGAGTVYLDLFNFKGPVYSDVLNPRALEGHERNLSTEEFITQRVGRTISQQ